ncbi:MAG: hypothetical protein WB919_06005 [Candidatus Sulfotelmatobacter sp.]
MIRKSLLLSAVSALVMFCSCRRSEVASPVIVQVRHDLSGPTAKSLGSTDLQFNVTNPHLENGKVVMIATERVGQYRLWRLAESGEDLLILNSQKDIPNTELVRNHLGKQQLVCGEALSFIPDWVSGEERQATEMYLRFLVAYCESDSSP